MDLTKQLTSHPSEDVLEEYVFHHLPETLAAHVEEHLLMCGSCQEAVHRIDDFASAMKAGAVASSRDPSAGGVRNWTALLTGAGPIFVTAAILVGIVVLHRTPHEPSPAVAVTLSSLRGPETLSIAPAGRLLELRIDAPDLTSARDYGVQVVDSGGNQVWKGTVTYTDGMLLTQIHEPLKAGVYWIRLYDAAGSALREFGMSVK